MSACFIGFPAASPCFFLLSQKSAKIVSLVPRLPIGGRLRREAVVRGASCFLSESFQSSGATCSPFPCFPLRESLLRCCQASAASRVARSAERGQQKLSAYFIGIPLPEKKFSELHFFRQKWESFPYVKASPCFFLLSQKSVKIVSLFHRLPLGGRLRREAVVRGASYFYPNLFNQVAQLVRPSLAFPVGLNPAELPFNAIPASRVARSAERGLFKTSPYVAASPCLKKIQRTSFFSAKMGILSLRQGFPLLLFAIAKISKNCQPIS